MPASPRRSSPASAGHRSLGVAPSHLAHAETFLSLGFAAFVVDPFGARSVVSTVADQTQDSFAASAYDVLAAFDVLADDARIDAGRIGAQGHSREARPFSPLRCGPSPDR